jgi:TonB-dependent SusC/RagA subfamily outer membrane receptor
MLAPSGVAQSPPPSHPDDSTAATPATGGLAELLMARFAGVLVSPAPASEPSGPRLRIRGPQTFMDSRAPLIIVDGLPVSSGATGLFMTGFFPGSPRVEDLRAWSIDSVSVLRGPAAAARYGPEAANGVILVRTKRGQQGGPRWTFAAGASRTSDFTWPSTFGGFDTDNPDSLMRTGRCALEFAARGTCVQDYISRRDPLLANRQLVPAWQRQLGLTVGGGGTWFDYFAGWEVENGDGALALASPEADRLRSMGQPVRDRMLDPDRGSRQTAVANARFRVGTFELGARGSRSWGRQGVPPITAVVTRGARGCCNPVPIDSSASLAAAFVPTTTLATDRWIGALDAMWTPAPDLTVSALVGQDDIHQDEDQFLLPGEGPPGSPAAGRTTIARRPDRMRTVDVRLAYDYAAGGRLAMRTTLGVQRVQLARQQFDSIGSGSLFAISQIVEKRRTLGFFLEQRASLGGLALTGMLRRDDFGGNFTAVTHPSIDLAWRVSSAIEVRAAYGSAGRWAYSEHQERTRELTVGTAGSLFRGRAGFDVTLYRMSSDAFVPAPPLVGGPPLNVAVIDNQGAEISLSGLLVDRPGMQLSLDLGLWGNRNRVTKLDGTTLSYPITGVAPQIIRPRRPVGWYSASGVPQYADANGDGIVARSELLIDPSMPGVEAGTPYPTQGASLSANVQLGKRVTIGATLEYQAGHQLFNAVGWFNCLQLVCRSAIDPATPLATQAEIAYRSTTPMFFEDADFARLRAFSVTVSAPPAVAAALRSQDISLTIVGHNLITWTGYTGLDPEPVTAEAGVGSFEAKSGGFSAPILPRWTVLMRIAY